MLLLGCTFSAIRQVEGSPQNLVGLLRHLLEVLVVEGGCFNPAVAMGMYFGGFCLDLEVLLAAAAGEELRLHAAGPGWKEAWLAAVLPCFNGPSHQLVLVFMFLSRVSAFTCCHCWAALTIVLPFIRLLRA